MRTIALALLVSLPVFAAGEILIVADEMPAMEVLAAKLEAGAGVKSTLVEQTAIPTDLSRYSAMVVYIHKTIGEPAEERFIEYAESGGKLVLLHHSISSGKRENKYWFPFLGVRLPVGEYKYYEGVSMEFVNLAKGNPVTSWDVKWPETAEYKGKRLPAIELDETEAYLNHVLEGERTMLLGMKFTEAKSGKVFEQDTAGWTKKAGKGRVYYFMAGHNARDFENGAYAQILVNAIGGR